jgi:phosphoglycerate dehydrogenase-like enzyme
MATIFLCDDIGQAPLLTSVSDALRARGHTVLRGPPNEVGKIRRYAADELPSLFGQADIAIFTGRHQCSREVMTAAPRLRGVCFPFTGVETIDLEAANELGIVVGHGAVRGNVVGMAEATLMLMLMLVYDVQTNIGLVRAGRWRRPGHNSHQLEGRVIGMIGFGRIAREMAARLAPFNVRIVTYSPRARPETLPAHVTKVDLDTLLEQSDVVSVLTGLSPETRHLLGRAQLERMKATAYLINTGRGEIIDEDALIAVLRDRRIAGAALDTFSIEPLPADSPLRTFDNVIPTPHCVGHTVESYEEFLPALMENIAGILHGRLPLHCKNPEAESAWRKRLERLT